ncbi:MAG: signal peptidase II [Solirubrobacteraceae bacterium]
MGRVKVQAQGGAERAAEPEGAAPTAAGGARSAASRRVRPARAWLLVGSVASCVLGADQLTKALVRGSLAFGAESKILPGLAFVRTLNKGVAFGIDPGSTAAVLLVIVAVLIVVGAYFARHSSERLYWLPTGMIFGGAIGNLVDRLREGAVTDFVKLPLGWPAFNLADACITVAVIVLAALIAFAGQGEGRGHADSGDDGGVAGR